MKNLAILFLLTTLSACALLPPKENTEDSVTLVQSSAETTSQNSIQIFRIEPLLLASHETVDVVTFEPGVTPLQLSEWLNEQGKKLSLASLNLEQIPSHTLIEALRENVHGIRDLLQSITIMGPIEEKLFLSSTDAIAVIESQKPILEIKLAIVPQVLYESKMMLMNEQYLEKSIHSCDRDVIHWFPHLKKIDRACGMITQSARKPKALRVPALKNSLELRVLQKDLPLVFKTLKSLGTDAEIIFRSGVYQGKNVVYLESSKAALLNLAPHLKDYLVI